MYVIYIISQVWFTIDQLYRLISNLMYGSWVFLLLCSLAAVSLPPSVTSPTRARLTGPNPRVSPHTLIRTAQHGTMTPAFFATIASHARRESSPTSRRTGRRLRSWTSSSSSSSLSSTPLDAALSGTTERTMPTQDGRDTLREEGVEGPFVAFVICNV